MDRSAYPAVPRRFLAHGRLLGLPKVSTIHCCCARTSSTYAVSSSLSESDSQTRRAPGAPSLTIHPPGRPSWRTNPCQPGSAPLPTRCCGGTDWNSSSIRSKVRSRRNHSASNRSCRAMSVQCSTGPQAVCPAHAVVRQPGRPVPHLIGLLDVQADDFLLQPHHVNLTRGGQLGERWCRGLRQEPRDVAGRSVVNRTFLALRFSGTAVITHSPQNTPSGGTSHNWPNSTVISWGRSASGGSWSCSPGKGCRSRSWSSPGSGASPPSGCFGC